MKKIIVLLTGILMMSTASVAQTIELGAMGGASYYLGDLNPGLHFKQLKPAGGAIARVNLDDHWSYRFSIFYGQLTSSDDYKPERNLSFKSPITDFSVVAEFNFWPYFTGSMKSYFTPYIFGGISFFMFDPMTLNGDKLRDAGTEGQHDITFSEGSERQYTPYGISFPFGLGFKYSLTKKIGLSLEWGMRKTFTDYLDDVSTTYYQDASGPTISDPTGDHNMFDERGNSGTNDWFNFVGLTITYKFNLNNASTCVDYRN